MNLSRLFKRPPRQPREKNSHSKLVISHFYNEEYMLPWWLKHHRHMFDHGVLIDNHSTDRSVEICRELVPDWEIIPSRNARFSGLMCDFEVMKHEERFPDMWKIVLNTTEFLVGNQIDGVIRSLVAKNHTGGRIPGAVMIDTRPDQPPDPDRPRVAQKHHGAWEATFPYARLGQDWYNSKTRTRTLHNFAIGAYKPGRHESHLPNLVNISPDHLGIWWYGYSPWSPEGIARKLQIQSTIDPFDKKVGHGHQHIVELENLQKRHAMMLEFARSLTVPPAYEPLG